MKAEMQKMNTRRSFIIFSISVFLIPLNFLKKYKG